MNDEFDTAGDQKRAQDSQIEPPPAFNVPLPLVVICAILIGIFAFQKLGGGILGLSCLAFSPQTLGSQFFFHGCNSPLYTVFSYSFLHGSWTHVLFNCFWLVVFGTPVLRRIGSFKFALLSALGSLAGALAVTLTSLNAQHLVVIVGASAVVSAMMGAAARFALHDLRNHEVHLSRRLTAIAAFKNPSASGFIAAFFIIQALIAFGFFDMLGNISWEAHIGGFLAGLLCFELFDARGPVERRRDI